jgi:L-seryl-tRNA(Ser) seleniumtransferase
MSDGSSNPMSRIPAVEKILHALETSGSLPPLPRLLMTEVVREEIAALREKFQNGNTDIGGFDSIVGGIRSRLVSLHRTRIHPVINGTGVIIHTNLGRAPLSPATADAIRAVGMNYNNIELDLDSGERGKRGGYLERCLALLCEAEAATVVNNCASALILILKHLANGERNEVVISRGELVEIGGGFRVPEIMEASGARLREVGATNKTSLKDYENAIGPKTGMLLKVHRSNFWMDGFVDEPTTEELVELGKRHGLPVVEDLGSGAMVQTDSLAPIPHEPTAAKVLERGIDLVCVSGDKLFGGPQAGIIAGRADLVAGLKKEPFFRALRCDKLILTGLQEVATEYLHHGGDSTPDLPLVRMLSQKPDDLRPRAEKIVAELGNGVPVTIGEGIARCGGGTMPKAEIPSVTLDFRPENMSLDKFARLLRLGDPPVMGYKSEEGFRIDLRTVFPEQDVPLVKNLLAIFDKS